VFPPPCTSAPFNDTPRNRETLKRCIEALDTWPKLDDLYMVDGGPGKIIFPSRSDIAIKIADRYGFAEASTMRWVAKHTSVPVPKVITALEVDGTKYIVMERPRGKPLGDSFERRSVKSRRRIYEQLKAMVDDMRAAPCPAGVRFENVDGGPLNSREINTDGGQEMAPGTYGPCSTISALEHQLFRDTLHKEPYNSSALDAEELANPDRPRLPSPLDEMATYPDDQCPPPVFTHGYLVDLNVWVDGDQITDILGWQGAGWWPDYWEYTQVKLCWWRLKDWKAEFPEYLTPYPRGLRLLSFREKNYFGCSCQRGNDDHQH